MYASILSSLAIIGFSLTSGTKARDIPSNVQTFHDRVIAEQQCTHSLQGGFYSREGGSKGVLEQLKVVVEPTNCGDVDYSYCKDDKSDALYIHGRNGKLTNMDIDCDGPKGGLGDDGRCDDSQDTQYQTAFKDQIGQYNVGIQDLNAKLHPYVVFGNDGTDPSFDPQKYGVKPLSVMAVVCGNKLVSIALRKTLSPGN